MMTNALGPGPALTVAVDVPDFHYFANRGGKDVLPLWRDSQMQEPNLASGLLDALNALRGNDPDLALLLPGDICAYVYGLLSTPGYQLRFADELRTPGPRVPLTTDPTLFDEVAATGQRLLWLHTYGERFRDPSQGRGRYLPDVPGLAWDRPVLRPPASVGAGITYDPDARTLDIGDGRIVGVSPEVWDYSVSGLQVVRKWLGYRTAEPSGLSARSGSPLDRIRPAGWPDAWNDELLDLLRLLALTTEMRTEQDALLERVCSGPCLAASSVEWPSPGDSARKPPAPAAGQTLPGV